MTASRPVNENFFTNLAFLTRRTPVIPSNPLQVLFNHTQVKSLKELGDYEVSQLRTNLKLIPQKEQDLIWGVLRGIHQKVLAAKFGLTQGAISTRLSKAVRRLLFYKDFPKLTETDYQKLGPYFSNLEIDIIRWMIITSCQTKTTRLVEEKYNIPFSQTKTRYRWKKMLAKVNTLPHMEQVSRAMNLVDKNLYIFHEVQFPSEWKQNLSFPHPWKKGNSYDSSCRTVRQTPQQWHRVSDSSLPTVRPGYRQRCRASGSILRNLPRNPPLCLATV